MGTMTTHYVYEKTINLSTPVVTRSFQYVDRMTSNNGVGTTTLTFTSRNLGTGSVYVILCLLSQNASVTGASVNGFGLTSIAASFVDGGPAIYAGGPVTVTGSDTVVMTVSSSMAFFDQNIVAFTATGLSSQTPKFTASANGQQWIFAAAPGDFIVGVGAASSTGSFSPSSQALDAGASATWFPGTSGLYMDYAGWTAVAGGIVGGNFTVQDVNSNYHAVASWS